VFVEKVIDKDNRVQEKESDERAVAEEARVLLEKHAKELRQQLETVQNKFVEENQRHELAQQELNRKATLVKVCC
jgi:uncharacterized protein involved in exopolysaccharide biosynthesis